MPILKPARGIQINKSLPLARGLVACWLFNEGSGDKVSDLSANTLTGTILGGTWVSGKYGSAISFDESNDYITIPSHAKLEWPDGSWSVWIWYYLSDNTGTAYQYILSHRSTSDTPNVNLFIYEAGEGEPANINKWKVYLKDNDGTLVEAIATTAIGADSKWHLLGLQRDTSAGEIQIWIDTKKDISKADTNVNAITTNYQLEIGRRADGNANRYFGGLISHVLKYDRALSVSEIALLYREPFYVLEHRLRQVFCYVTAGGIVNFEGASTGQSASSGTILVSIRVNGSITSSTESTAIVKLTRKAVGVCLSTSDVTAILKTKQNIVGQLNTTTKVSGLLSPTGEIALVGATNALSIFSGMLTFIFFEPWFIASLNIERNWLVAALFVGMTSDAFKLSTVLGLGWFWMRTAGCTALYRGLNRNRIDLANALAVVENHVDIISPPKYLPHYNDTAYYYLIRRFNNCGYQEQTLQAATKIQIDPSGKLTQPQPNSILIARAEQIGTNKIKLLWFYCPIEQKSAPGYFKICSDKGTGQIDYKNPIATIDYKGSKFYSYECSELNAERYLFAVKTENAAGKQDNSLSRLRIQQSYTSPEPIGILNAESI